jgi:uncharacterized protein YceK
VSRSLRLLALVLALSAAACMTVDTRRSKGYDGPRVYSGTRASLELIRVAAIGFNVPFFLIWAVDLPFSFVADTLLLPLTIGEERRRSSELTTAARVDVELPGPVRPIAGTSPERNAQQLFEACVTDFEQLDPRVSSCYSVDARVTAADGSVTTGSAFKPELRSALERIRADGGFLTYHDATYLRDGDGVRIQATLKASFLDTSQPASFRVAPGPDGDWRITEAQSPPWK